MPVTLHLSPTDPYTTNNAQAMLDTYWDEICDKKSGSALYPFLKELLCEAIHKGRKLQAKDPFLPKHGIPLGFIALLDAAAKVVTVGADNKSMTYLSESLDWAAKDLKKAQAKIVG